MAVAKYDISYDYGETWQPVTPTELRKRISKVTSNVDGIIKEIKEGRIYFASGWGTFRRRNGRWNSKTELNKAQAKYLARLMVLMDVDVVLPSAMRDKDKDLIEKEIKLFVKEQLAKLKENKEALAYLDKIQRYSPHDKSYR